MKLLALSDYDEELEVGGARCALGSKKSGRADGTKYLHRRTRKPALKRIFESQRFGSALPHGVCALF